MLIEQETYLSHYGVKGMQWGVRKDRIGGSNRASKKIDRDARKDAEEIARAKMFYGDGAGNRRKLIRETVNAKKKRNPEYAKAFDKHLSEQDLSKHANKAVKERKRTDRTVKTKQRAGYFARMFTGEMGNQAAFMAVIAAGAAFAASPRGRQMMRDLYSKVTESPAKSEGVAFLEDYFKRNS